MFLFTHTLTHLLLYKNLIIGVVVTRPWGQSLQISGLTLQNKSQRAEFFTYIESTNWSNAIPWHRKCAFSDNNPMMLCSGLIVSKSWEKSCWFLQRLWKTEGLIHRFCVKLSISIYLQTTSKRLERNRDFFHINHSIFDYWNQTIRF